MSIYIITIIAIFIAIIFKSKKTLHMFQQNLYNDGNRYLKWLIKNPKMFFDIDILTIAASLLGVILYHDIKNISIILLILISVISVINAYFWDKRIAQDQQKKPLVITKRLKRLIYTTIIVHLIPMVSMFCYFDNTYFVWSMILLTTAFLYLNPFIILVTNIINKPWEKGVYLFYYTKAVKKLKNSTNLKVIGITGSYGKTSSKNILSDILNIKYNVLPSPKNLNTPYGLMITVNNHLDKFHEIFIAEMGAYKKGEIKQLCNFVKPKYGILTTIGTAHLESFGSEENIIKGKFELIESLPKDGFAVLNKDDKKQVNYNLKNKIKTLWIGIDSDEVDVKASNIKYSKDGAKFNVTIKGDKKKYEFQTRLLGNHNIYNILAGIACGIEFGITIKELQQSVKAVNPVEHRLELKKLGKFYQIDDAYNSNPVGAKNAVEVLGMMPGVKVVVTPGMIELGPKEDEYNEKFGMQIAEVADYVVLIGAKKTKPIKAGLLKAGYDEDNIIVYNDVKQAYNFINGLKTGKKDIYALFENDLPDTYNE